jgi:XTP/dITP diphosphohydrolase
VLKRIVIASGNAGKLAELRALLAPEGVEAVAQGDLGIAEAEEPHATFVENALAKARHASRSAGLPALADDSGIVVRALGGAPGVRSARFAGDPRSDARNNATLVSLLARASDRHAHFYCVIVLVRDAEDPEPLIAEGRWHGEIVLEPRGASGFGYDPHFLVPALGRTAAELEPAEKNRLSHRAQALRRLLALLREGA